MSTTKPPSGVPADACLHDLISIGVWLPGIPGQPLVYQMNYDAERIVAACETDGPVDQVIGALLRAWRGLHGSLCRQFKTVQSPFSSTWALIEHASEFAIPMPGARAPFYIRRMEDPAENARPCWAITWGPRDRYTVLTHDGVFEVEPLDPDDAWCQRARYDTPEAAASALHTFWASAPTWIEVVGCGTGHIVRSTEDEAQT